MVHLVPAMTEFVWFSKAFGILLASAYIKVMDLQLHLLEFEKTLGELSFGGQMVGDYLRLRVGFLTVLRELRWESCGKTFV